MSGNSKSLTERIINDCENKPNLEKWMEVTKCFQDLQGEVDGLMKKYPTEAGKRKVPVTQRQPPPEAVMTKNVKTVLEYLENVQIYNPKSADKKEAAKREFLDMAHFVYEFKHIDKEQGKGDNVSCIQVPSGGASSPGTGGQQKDIDEMVSDKKKPKHVYNSGLSITCTPNQKSQPKDKSLAKTLPASSNPTTVDNQQKNEKQSPVNAGAKGEKLADEKKNEKTPFKVEDMRNKFQSDHFAKTAGPHSKPGIHTKPTLLTKPENQLKDNTFSETLPANKPIKFDMQKDEKQLDIAKGGKEKEEDKKNKKSADENKVEELQKRICELNSKVKQMESAQKKLNEKADVAEKRCKMLDDEKGNLNKTIEQLETRCKIVTDEKGNLNKTIEELQTRNTDYDNQLQELQQKYMVKEAQCDNLRLRLNNAESRNADVESDNKYLKEQVDELTMRLSSFASKQLSDGNPNVADLSDQNRPTKIGEKFGSLYDDEWSEAFDAITTPEKSEDDAIKYLINIIQKSYTFCTKTADEQLVKLTEKMKTLMKKFEYKDKEGQTHEINSSLDDTPNIDSARAKYAKDYRKAAACESLLGVKQMFKERELKEELDKLSGETKDSVIAYVDKCTELIWFMVVQDPPMVIEIPEPGKKFNANAFKPYKTKGKLVKLAVWPAVKLFENGGLISKGYALPE